MLATCSVQSSVPTPIRRPAVLSRRSGLTSLTIRLVGAGGMFLSHIILARSLGVAAFGEYSLAIAWLQVLTVGGKLGLDNSSLRYVSEYVTKGEFGKLAGFRRESIRASLVASSAISLTMALIVFVYWNRIGSSLAWCLILCSSMVPLVAIRQIQEASLRGIGHLFESQIGTAIWPLILAATAGIAWVSSESDLSSPAATSMHLLAVASVFLLVFRFQQHSSRDSQFTGPAEYSRDIWKQTAIAFLCAEGLIALKGRACVAIAGMLLDRESVGLYGAMEKFADVSLLASQSLGIVIAPQFASLSASGRFAEMRKLMWQGQLIGLAFTLPVAIFVACFSETVFALLGPGYRDGWTVLITLLASACIAAFSGPAAYVLQMTGSERVMLVITGACALTNIILSLVLIKSQGILGLGLAQMVTSLVWTVSVRSCLVRHPAWQVSSQTAVKARV